MTFKTEFNLTNGELVALLNAVETMLTLVDENPQKAKYLESVKTKLEAEFTARI